MSFPRYPKYKPSSVEWLSEVPAHWEVMPLKSAATYNDEVLEENNPPETEITYVDISSVDSVHGITNKEPMLFGEAPSRARRRVKSGDVIISTVRTYLRAIACIRNPEENLIVSTGFAVIRPRSNLVAEFLGFALRSSHFVEQVIARSTGVSYPAINASELVSIVLPTPPLDEQTAIAGFLDRETAKIDALVAEQQRLVELLKEKRQAVISHAVTKGLDPTAPMKPSGIEWLGDIPTHWAVSQSRRLFAQRNSRAVPGDRQLTASQEHGVLFQEDFVKLEGRKVMEVIKGADILKHVEPNDFVISMRSFQGGIELCNNRGCISSAYVMLIPCEKIDLLFFGYLFKCKSYIQALQSTTNLVRDGQALRYDNFIKVSLPLVPLGEQKSIASFLDAETAKFDALTAEAQRAIELLQERRTALISAAVTGKIDVRSINEKETA